MTNFLTKISHKSPYIVGSVLTRVFMMVVEGVRGKSRSVYQLESFIDHAKTSNGGSFPDQEVDETKSLARIIPIFIMLIFFWTVYIQVSVKVISISYLILDSVHPGSVSRSS